MAGTRPLLPDELERLREAFKGIHATRDLTLFVLGVNTGFRISELLSLDIRDVCTRSGKVFDAITVRRASMKGKVGSRTVRLNRDAKRTLQYWVSKCLDNGATPSFPLFMSQQGTRMHRNRAWQILRTAYDRAGIPGKVGTHSMRKTFAERVYSHLLDRVAAGEKIDPVRLIQKALGHRSIDATDQYLQFKREEIDRSIEVASWG